MRRKLLGIDVYEMLCLVFNLNWKSMSLLFLKLLEQIAMTWKDMNTTRDRQTM